MTYDDDVFGFGPNSSGCLGVESGTGKMCLFKPVPLKRMRGKLIKGLVRFVIDSFSICIMTSDF